MSKSHRASEELSVMSTLAVKPSKAKNNITEKIKIGKRSFDYV